MSAPPNERERLKLLASAVNAARQTNFWRPRLGDSPIASLSDFQRLPITHVHEYRAQRFADLLADPGAIDWIPGSWLGQSPDRAPVAEGATEARIRVEIMREALSHAVPDDMREPTAVVASTFDNRYFAAEMCAVFVRMGIPAHLVSDCGTDRLAELVDLFAPDIIAILSDRLDIDRLPKSVQRIITVGSNAPSTRPRHVNLYVCNELGVLGMRTDAGQYSLFHHAFHFEISPNDTLVVTPYFSLVQPIIRLDTGDRVFPHAPII